MDTTNATIITDKPMCISTVSMCIRYGSVPHTTDLQKHACLIADIEGAGEALKQYFFHPFICHAAYVFHLIS